jgi:hypothetical protein
MFTQPCFIQKNTPELIKKLEELGYKNAGKVRYFGESIYTYCEHKVCYVSAYKIRETYNTFIDCGTNEELFLAVAALRNDTDKHQWFIYNSMDCTIEQLRTIEWVKCTEDKIEDMMYWDSMHLNCKKATIEELIEHFKN